MRETDRSSLITGIKAIIFDLEGVIIDSERIWDLETKEFLGRRGIAYERGAIKHLIAGCSVFGAAGILKERFRLDGSVRELGMERISIFRSLFRKELSFIPGFTAFHGKVNGRFRTAIATSMEKEILEDAIAILSLDRYFGRHIYSIADVGGVAKPAPDLFLFASKKLETKPQACLVIEDSPLGITAAARASMRSCALASTFDKALLKDADLVVSSFDEIPF